MSSLAEGVGIRIGTTTDPRQFRRCSRKASPQKARVKVVNISLQEVLQCVDQRGPRTSFSVSCFWS